MPKVRKIRARRRVRRSNFRRPRKFTLPVAAVAGLIPLAGRGIEGFQSGYAAGGFASGMHLLGTRLTSGLTGWDADLNTWDWTALKSGLLPMILGVLAHKVVGGMLGVNQMLGRAGVPVVRV